MNKEVEKIFTERGFTNIEQMATMFDWYKEEIERLHSIIKEVREYVNNIMFETKAEEKIQDDILEILDKVGSENSE